MLAKHLQYFVLCSLCSLGCATGLGGCVFDLPGNGHRANETRNVTDFTRVELDGSFDVAIEQGDEFSVRVSIDSNLLKHIETRVEKDTLELASDLPIGRTVAGPHVIVTMPNLQRAMLLGSGDLSLREIASADPISLQLEGSGDLHFDGSTPELTLRMQGSGNADLAGEADHINLRVDGSGTIDAKRLTAATGVLEVRGSGNIRASLDESADVTIEGSGDIDLYGDGKLSHSDIEGSGDLHRHAP